jgi:hypothetical protein
MKRNKLFLLVFATLCWACKKQTVYNGQPLSIAVFNGLNDGAWVYGNYSGSRPVAYIYSQLIGNGGGALTVSFEEPQVRARYFVFPDTLETDKPVFDKELEVVNGKSYSLYLMGEKTQADYLFFENKFKVYQAGDSVTYLQVVNISNDQPVSINLKGEPKGSLIDRLAYKEASLFLELNVDHHHTAYEFEFRDAATGDLLFTELVDDIDGASIGVNRFLYKNWAMVFAGKRNALDINAIKVSRIYFQGK